MSDAVSHTNHLLPQDLRITGRHVRMQAQDPRRSLADIDEIHRYRFLSPRVLEEIRLRHSLDV
jgi:hypothetical protein